MLIIAGGILLAILAISCARAIAWLILAFIVFVLAVNYPVAAALLAIGWIAYKVQQYRERQALIAVGRYLTKR